MRFKSDLEWLLASPHIIQSEHNLRLSELEITSVNADNFVLESTHRLGVYFEQLWHHLVHQSPTFELRAKNLQVIIDKHTWGEFDSIVKKTTAEDFIHCEVAVKFYLQVGQGKKLSDWVGPNLKDRFDLKYQRLTEHQLMLSQKAEIQQWLRDKNLPITQSKLITRGRLFYPFQQWLSSEWSFPVQVNPKHDKGFWLTAKELAASKLCDKYQCFWLPKDYWLASLTADEIHRLEAIEGSLELEQQPVRQMVCWADEQEYARGFVVPESWLTQAKARVLMPE